MYTPIPDPVGGSLTLSALIATLPLLTVFALLGIARWKAQWAALAGLAVTLLVAVLAYRMPAGQAFSAAAEGAAFGLFPIMWIVVNAIWVYNLTVATGHFDVLRRSFAKVSDDQRIQAIIIAFCFGGLLEALAGFGTPVAITAVMLIAMGFEKFRAAAVALVANTAPVAFGAMAVPITTLASITGLPEADLAAMVGRQTPILAVFVPLVLVSMVDGRRGLRQTWPAAVVGGLTFGILQFLCSNFASVALTDIAASLGGALAVVLLLRVWRPAGAAAVPEPVAVGGGDGIDTDATAPTAAVTQDSRSDMIKAYAPYLVIIAVFSIAQAAPIAALLKLGTIRFAWPGLDIVLADGSRPSAITFKLELLQSGGTLLLVSGLLSMIILGLGPAAAARAYGATVHQLRWAILTVACVLALAYVMNLSGQTTSIGLWMAGAGMAFAFLSPILGWLGVAVTGSDTSSNALFGTLQVAAAQGTGLSPTLLAAANSSGGVLGKMISPQNLAIAAAAVGISGQEGVLLRRLLPWTVVFLLGMCLLIFLQSTPILGWMVP
ncbi:lactate permease [Naumannella cuiyingiana]|uniref:L-lactate permease n=1 Tax=Naumannella cuiyingiana TaxID=1347891 RepID=A0A7Z0D8E4_9ACTN|nr:L-lactate permease [Naumannella cuiyingiana]NYI70659.1 lactate permease [Naumannella cuiyingiana]